MKRRSRHERELDRKIRNFNTYTGRRDDKLKDRNKKTINGKVGEKGAKNRQVKRKRAIN